jgi:hypothetical protein
LVTTVLVIAEAAYLITRQLGPAAEAALYSAIIDGDLEVAALGRTPRAGHRLRQPAPGRH